MRIDTGGVVRKKRTIEKKSCEKFIENGCILFTHVRPIAEAMHRLVCV